MSPQMNPLIFRTFSRNKNVSTLRCKWCFNTEYISAYQNIVVKIGADEYKYSEAWSLGAKGAPYDLFSVPEDLRDQLYFSTVLYEYG